MPQAHITANLNPLKSMWTSEHFGSYNLQQVFLAVLAPQLIPCSKNLSQCHPALLSPLGTSLGVTEAARGRRLSRCTSRPALLGTRKAAAPWRRWRCEFPGESLVMVGSFWIHVDGWEMLVVYHMFIRSLSNANTTELISFGWWSSWFLNQKLAKDSTMTSIPCVWRSIHGVAKTSVKIDWMH